eukprot:scaffold3359_cov123-Cylindrotheca_fusiformis.AAC.12
MDGFLSHLLAEHKISAANVALVQDNAINTHHDPRNSMRIRRCSYTERCPSSSKSKSTMPLVAKEALTPAERSKRAAMAA